MDLAVPSPWTEPAVDASLTARAAKMGHVPAVRVPADWEGREVRLLLLPRLKPAPSTTHTGKGQGQEPPP